jgi:hypothetical protein
MSLHISTCTTAPTTERTWSARNDSFASCAGMLHGLAATAPSGFLSRSTKFALRESQPEPALPLLSTALAAAGRATMVARPSRSPYAFCAIDNSLAPPTKITNRSIASPITDPVEWQNDCGLGGRRLKARVQPFPRSLHPRQRELRQIRLHFGIAGSFGQANTLGSTLHTFLRVSVHGGNLRDGRRMIHINSRDAYRGMKSHERQNHKL